MQFIHHNPWELMSSLRRDADGLFQPNAEPARAFVPAVDIHEETERYRVQADLPGIDPAEIEITVDGDLLTIKGERKTAGLVDGATVQRAERARGPFERIFRLPETAASEGVEAEYRQGVLTVSIPKAEAAIPYRIPVTAN
jgi:HSP20 family protein